jgi:hypothetical protein
VGIDILDSCSVIIQGKVFGKPEDVYGEQLTQQCIESVRKVLPKAEVILSTWEGTDVSHLSYDKLVLNNDPGAISYSDLNPKYLNNTNRQIVSTYNGLLAATENYAIKLRGDCQLRDTAFTNFLKPYARTKKYKFLEERVIVPTLYSRNPRRIAQLIHPSDIYQVGLLKDLLNIWNIPLQPEPSTTRAIPANKVILNDPLVGSNYRMKFGPEQYIWYCVARQHGEDFELKYFSHLPLSKIIKSEWSIINNFIIADSRDIGLVLPEKMQFLKVKDLYSHNEWQKLYHQYCVAGISRLFTVETILQVYSSNLRWVIIRVVKSIVHKMKTLSERKS